MSEKSVRPPCKELAPHKRAKLTIERLNSGLDTMTADLGIEVDSNTRRKLLAYSTIMVEPSLLPQLAESYETTLNIISHAASEVLDNPDIKLLGRSLVDRIFDDLASIKQPLEKEASPAKNATSKISARKAHELKKLGSLYTENEDWQAYARANVEVVNEDNREIAALALCGLSAREIAQKLSMNEGTVATYLKLARKELEANLFSLSPMNLTRITRKVSPTDQDKRRAQAVKTKVLKTVELADIHYATPEQLEDFNQRERILSEMSEKGYLLLREHVDENGYATIIQSKQYQPYIHRSQRRIFVHQDDLPTIMTMMRQNTKREIFDPHYASVNDATKTMKEAGKVRHKIKKKEIEPVTAGNKLFLYIGESSDEEKK
ncbi:MAG TPA: sigma factor-like helix-turn-helix DNA-binding protein [Patescibacteria group bacterium]|nr:sigma factor-like helix-turn-helix DNA-binding protein [Patescibacteria group bacterium]